MVAKRWKKLILSLGLLTLAVTGLGPVIADEKPDPEEPIKNLAFQSAEIQSVLTFLADYGGVNVVVGPEVKGNVTIKLNNVKWRAAMDIIGRTYNLAIVDEVDGYIRVLPADQYRKEITEQELHKKSQRELVALETKIISISNSTAGDIVQSVKSMLTDRGKAISDLRSNSIIVQEVPGHMEKVVSFVKELDKPSRQIKISAQLLEIFTQDLSDLGINWGAEGTYTSASGNRSYPQSAELVDRITDHAGSYSVMALHPGWSVKAAVEALVNSGRGKVIAHPEITTIDNKEARIQMGQKIPIKQFDASGNVVIVFEEVGTILSVTPHITAENQILMHIKPERSTYQFDPNGVIINISTAETNVIVANGQTAVIGGLTTQDEVETVIGIPVLKDIPILGVLFRFTNKRIESRDLVIFVTPTIVDLNLAIEG